MRLLLFFLLIASTLFNSCDIINPDEQVPGYVKVNDYFLTTTPSEGTSSHNIREMWVYANDNMNGAYSIPSNVPVLNEGTTKITCYAGIWNNGIGSLRIRYPFYAGYDTTVTFNSGETVEVTPHFEYLDGLQINTARDFEGALGFNSVSPNQGVISQVVEPQLIYEGTGSARIVLNEGQDYFLFSDANAIAFQTGNTVFLEMDYSCNNSFTIGCYVVDGVNTSKIGIVTMTPTTSNTELPTWNKIYLDLGALAMAIPGADSYRIYFEGVRSESTAPKIFLDNLKLVKFEE